MTDTKTRLRELQETIRRAEAEIAEIESRDHLRKAIRAYDWAASSLDSDEEIETGLRAAYPDLRKHFEGDDA